MTSKKTVVLCEGRHDLLFLSILLDRHNKTYVSRTWDQICGRSYFLSGEKAIISNFLRQREHSSFLLKQDEDRDTCINHFWMIYGYGDDRYYIRAVQDYDNTKCLSNYYNVMIKQTGKDLLNKCSDYSYSLKTDRSSGVFFYPTSLTNEVFMVTGKDLKNYHDSDSQRKLLLKFLENEPAWVSVLENFLVNEII